MTWPVMIRDGVEYEWEPADRKMKPLRPEFRSWARRFQLSAEGRSALSALVDLRVIRPHLYRRLKLEVLFSCWCASEFANQSDTPERVRVRLRGDWAEQLPRQIEHAFEILRFLEKRETDRRETFTTGYSDWVLPSPPDRLEIALNEYMDFLVHYIQRKSRRDWVACLDYGRPVEDHRKPNEARIGLAFELTLRFKHWTDIQQCPNPFDVLDKGLPRRGAPNYKLVARLLEAALHGRSIRIEDKLRKQAKKVEDDLRDLVKRHPDIKFIGWPIPAPSWTVTL